MSLSMIVLLIYHPIISRSCMTKKSEFSVRAAPCCRMFDVWCFCVYIFASTMGECWVFKCNSRSEKGHKLHLFPKPSNKASSEESKAVLERRQQWIVRVNRQDPDSDVRHPKLLIPGPYAKLCEVGAVVESRPWLGTTLCSCTSATNHYG